MTRCSVIRVISLDVEAVAEPDNASRDFASWCGKEFCGVEPGRVVTKAQQGPGSFIGGTVLPHTIPMYEARHRPTDRHRNKSLVAIDRVRKRLDQLQPDVIVLASTHWMPRDGFFIDDGSEHADGCDASYQGVKLAELFSFPGDPELAAVIGDLARAALVYRSELVVQPGGARARGLGVRVISFAIAWPPRPWCRARSDGTVLVKPIAVSARLSVKRFVSWAEGRFSLPAVVCRTLSIFPSRRNMWCRPASGSIGSLKNG